MFDWKTKMRINGQKINNFENWRLDSRWFWHCESIPSSGIPRNGAQKSSYEGKRPQDKIVKSLCLPLGEARGGLGGLKLEAIEAANSFPMLPMARNGLKWPVISPFLAYFSRICHVIFQYLSIYHSTTTPGAWGWLQTMQAAQKKATPGPKIAPK